MNEVRITAYDNLPRAESHRLIDFQWAEVATLESIPPQFLLQVRGTKPYANMEVDPIPLVFIRQPEYWGIEVVGRLRGGLELPAEVPYQAFVPLTGVTGTRGVEVVRATRSERIDVPPGEQSAGYCHDWSAWHDHQPPGPAVLRVTGQCEFPTAGYSVELRRQEPQGINPKDLLLNKVVHEPAGPAGPAATVITRVEARYEEETDFEYDTVTILPDGPSIPVEDVY